MAVTAHQKQNPVLIRGGLLIDGTGREPLEDASILIQNGRIKELQKGLKPVPGESSVIDARGKTILPGLIDMHAHLISGGFDTITNVGIIYDLELSKRLLKQMLYWGVTAVYNPVQPLELGLELRRQAAAGTFLSPRLFISGPAFTAPGGWAGTNDPSARFEPRTTDDVRAQLDRLARAQVDIVKLFYEDMSSAFVHPLPKLEKPLMEAVIREAHRRNLKVMIHAYDNRNHKETMEAGADIMAHSAVTVPVDEEYIALARRNRLLYLATLCVFQDAFDKNSIRELIAKDFVRRTVPQKTLSTLSESGPLDEFEGMIQQANIRQQLPTIRQNLERLCEAGISVGVGPDTGVMGAFPGIAVHREMELMVRAGVPPTAVLVAATRTGAECLNRADFGTVEPGKIADLVIFNSNPLEDITNTRDIDMVIKDGAVVDREQLLAAIFEMPEIVLGETSGRWRA
jgi:imidazolonepropionase-like amidohydrolase